MIGLTGEAGHEITATPSDADVLVVNTCAFIDSAKQESIDAILEMAEHKRTGNCQRLVVTGCLAERYRDELKRELGTGEVPDIVNAVGTPVRLFRSRSDVPASVASMQCNGSHPTAQTTRGGDPGSERSASAAPRVAPSYLYDASTPRVLTTPRHFAYVKIAEGCDYTCAFCIIPSLRGAYRSRSIGSVVDEARRLADRGVRELLLVSQDTTFYGNDRGERHALARLLRALNRVEGLHWIRLLYLYPTTVTDETLDAIAESAKVCRYIDMPLQHASSATLRRMKRPGTRASYERLLDRIRTRLPGVALRTTFIVGFPGETDADFAELEDFVRSTAFDHVGVFTYSHEEGTSAHDLDDDVPARVKKARRSKLMAVQKRIVRAHHRRLRGRTVEVLVDGPSAEHDLVLQARFPGQAPDIDSVVYLTECDPAAHQPGDLISATIVGSQGYDLVARPAVVN
jgi:ribosomal protein S12 methylthiotransferase